MKKLIIKGLFVFACFAASASSLASGPGWVHNVKVTKIVAVINGGVNVRVLPEVTNCISQSNYGPNYASIYPDHLSKEYIQSILLTAYIADKPVSLYLQDSTCKVTEVILGGSM